MSCMIVGAATLSLVAGSAKYDNLVVNDERDPERIFRYLHTCNMQAHRDRYGNDPVGNFEDLAFTPTLYTVIPDVIEAILCLDVQLMNWNEYADRTGNGAECRRFLESALKSACRRLNSDRQRYRWGS